MQLAGWCAERLVGVDIDVTERKRTDEHQRKLHAEPDHRLKKFTRDLTAVAAHTMEASSSMDHFVASLDGGIRSMARTHDC